MVLEDWASVVPALVAVVSAAVAGAALRARAKTGNAAIGWVAAGFGLLALKSAFKAWHLSAGPESLQWEIGFSLLDLLAVLLIAWPLLRRWGRRIS